MISDKSAERARELSPKVTAALVDALSPLVTRGAIVAVSCTALVAIDDEAAVPVAISLAINPHAMMALMEALKGYAGGSAPLLEQSGLRVAIPVKQ